MLKKWNLATLLALLLLGATAAVAETARPPIANKVDAYSSAQGVQVWTLRVGERTANQALVQITGVDNDWDKRIQKMDVEKTFKDVRYSTLINGKRFIALIVDNGYAEVYLPGETQSIKVAADSALASEGNPEYFLTDYLQQRPAH